MKEYTSLSDELNKLSKEKKELIEKKTYQLISQINTIKYLQEKLDISEEELMNYVDENNLLVHTDKNLELNTLKTLIEKLGGSIEIKIKIPNKDSLFIY